MRLFTRSLNLAHMTPTLSRSKSDLSDFDSLKCPTRVNPSWVERERAAVAVLRYLNRRISIQAFGEAMFVNRRDVQIQWGDCDPANIVYYPRYFEMFDDSTSILFEAAGFSKQDIIKKYGLVGIPMVDTRAKFHIASTHGDWITIESRIESFKRSSFEVIHKVFKGEALAIEAFETRVLVGRHPDDPARLKSAAVPEEIIAKFMRG